MNNTSTRLKETMKAIENCKNVMPNQSIVSAMMLTQIAISLAKICDMMESNKEKQ